jgi:predicted transcriptional regulator
MSYELTTLSFEQKDLSLAEHSILNILAFRANDDHECWPSIRSLIQNSSADRKTALKVIQSLIDKGLIKKTGEMKGKTRSVPVYKLTLSGPKNGTARKLSGPVFSASSPKNGTAKQSQKRDMEYKDLNINKNVDFQKKINQKTTPQHPPLTKEYKELLSKYYHGLKYPELQLTGNELTMAIALSKRKYD